MNETPEQVRERVARVVDRVRRFKDRAEVEAAGFVPGWAPKGGQPAPVEVGDEVVVWGHGALRLAIATKVTPMWVHAEFTTPGAVDEARKAWERGVNRNPLAERARVYEQELRNWDFYQQEVGPNPKYPEYRQPGELERYQQHVDEGREQYAARLADERAEQVREAAKTAAAYGPSLYLNVTNGKGDRTGRKGSNLYVKGASA